MERFLLISPKEPMEILLELFHQLTDPNWIMNNGGLYLVMLIIFIETGLFFGFFLPGDPLLFISGMVIASADQSAIPFTNPLANLLFWSILFIVATILGNVVGYWTGNRFSHIFRNKDRKSRFLKPQHISAAEDFYTRRGGFAILIARFLPIVRTFVPIVAGIVKMDKKTFMLYNISGAILWVGVISTLGFVLGENKWVENNLGWTMLILIVIVTAPVIIKLFKKQPTQAL
ncbi:MAG TPA: DedA family protein [Flavobacteriaceae bacterium]|nr:DedA family protein [Flavobacteriaceae bacterium]